MSSPRLADYLGHMLTAAREARGFVEGLSRETFLADRRTQQAVVMSLLIIGEAAAKIIDTEPAFVRAHPEVRWRNMRGMRNRMAHGYFETNYELVWETISTEIPRLITRAFNPSREARSGRERRGSHLTGQHLTAGAGTGST